MLGGAGLTPLSPKKVLTTLNAGPADPCKGRYGLHLLTMQITTPPSSAAVQPHGDFKVAASLAALLQRVDANPQAIGAAQYQQLVLQLGQLLDQQPPGAPLQQLLSRFPAAALVYDNHHYAAAGLCRSPLEVSLRSEQAARAAITKARALPS